jgi:sirohydrochlorin ferrochelatase
MKWKPIDEIICHPYFLSPGRHVREDIPQIIEEAIASLQIEIPVITTDPLGSNTQLMLGAIHSLVRENSQVLKSKNA